MEKKLYPLGVRRDGSYYTRVLWSDTTEKDPLLWVANLIDDDLDRNGGTWGANTTTTANAVLDFFGETLPVKQISIFRNVGITISVHGELAKYINIYVNNTNEPRKLRSFEDKVDDVEWKQIAHFDVIMNEGWQSIVLDEPVDAKFIRVELKDNFCNGEIPWDETNELKLFPEVTTL